MVCMCVHTYAHAHMQHARPCTYTCTHVHAHRHMNTRAHMHMHTRTYACTCTHACTHWPGPKVSPHSVNALSHPGLPPPFFWPAWCLSPHFPIPGLIPTRCGLRSPLKAGRMVRGKNAASTPHFIPILSSPSQLQK